MSRLPHWDLPAPPNGELVTAVAALFLTREADLITGIEQRLAATISAEAREDPGLVKAVFESLRANALHWVRAQADHPGGRVPVHRVPEVLDLAADLVRRGLEDATLDAYRVAQHLLWQVWTNTVFEVVTEPDALRDILTTTGESLAAFVDDTVSTLRELIEQQREALRSGTHVEQLRAVDLILEGAPITDARASALLRYNLDGRHFAAVLWSESRTEAPAALERLANELAHSVGAAQLLTLWGSSSVLWAWWRGGIPIDAEQTPTAIAAVPHARVAVGSVGAGRDGFRRAHLHARAVQQLMLRTSRMQQLVTYREVEPVALITQDPAETTEFVRRNLGDLAAAPRVLRETLRAYLREQSSPTKAARALYTHRNTVVAKVARATELLPPEAARFPLNVELALEVDHWLGEHP